MGVLKKINRKKKVQVIKEMAKEIIPVVKADRAGKQIAKNNISRIVLYCHSYYLPCFAYVMHKTFGWGFRRLKALDASMNHIFEVIAASRADKKHYLYETDLPGFLCDDAKYRFEPLDRVKKPEAETVEGFAVMWAKNYSFDQMDALESIWLWCLYADFGFGKSRLAKAREAVRKLDQMNPERFYAMLDEMERECRWTHDGETTGMTFGVVRERLGSLDFDEDGLTLYKRIVEKGA